MKIIVAPDSFKGSMTSTEASEAIRKGLLEVDEDLDVVLIPMADGGEGTVEALTAILGGEKQSEEVEDPLGRQVCADFGWIEKTKTAVIETAAASGLPLLKEGELDPYHASTYGTGQLVSRALDLGADKVILGLGGSATVDAGTGFFEALGIRFLDEAGNRVQASGGKLGEIKSIDATHLDSRLADVEFTIASDVTNPLLGREGAVAVFGPQKGVTEDELVFFENGMGRYAETVASHIGKEYRSDEGSGAAGGFGFSLLAFLQPKFENGFTLISKLSGLESQISQSRLVITGEGKVDGQSLYGKVPIGIARIAAKHHVPAIAFAGKIEGDLQAAKRQGLSLVLPIVDEPMTLSDAMEKGSILLQRAASRFMTSVLLLGGKDKPSDLTS
ncbi:glycerate kinase [Pseudalkalibacillus salsuginis]|uniref:glycerate kinase n=1 Tax=Pseudalkalibacillus salsuginis TaxID=2910972 RepID=UPI001F1F2FB6|nr:glycerate kinase [Pseudalkalibacillus salsuginis]MCF6410796.1 glycerate kinase [Pseudalkalibacillus salsuginis]